MRSLIACFALLVGFLASGLLVHAQDSRPTDKTDESTSANASEAEVNELRSEVAAQARSRPDTRPPEETSGPWTSTDCPCRP